MEKTRRIGIGEKQKKASKMYRPDNKAVKNRLKRKAVRIPDGKHTGGSIFGRMINGIKAWFGWRPPTVTASVVKGQGMGPTKKGYHKGCFGGFRYIKWRVAERKADEALERAEAGILSGGESSA